MEPQNTTFDYYLKTTWDTIPWNPDFEAQFERVLSLVPYSNGLRSPVKGVKRAPKGAYRVDLLTNKQDMTESPFSASISNLCKESCVATTPAPTVPTCPGCGATEIHRNIQECNKFLHSFHARTKAMMQQAQRMMSQAQKMAKTKC